MGTPSERRCALVAFNLYTHKRPRPKSAIIFGSWQSYRQTIVEVTLYLSNSSPNTAAVLVIWCDLFGALLREAEGEKIGLSKKMSGIRRVGKCGEEVFKRGKSAVSVFTMCLVRTNK